MVLLDIHLRKHNNIFMLQFIIISSTQTNSGDPKSSSSLVYVLSPGSAKTSTTNTIGGTLPVILCIHRSAGISFLSGFESKN